MPCASTGHCWSASSAPEPPAHPERPGALGRRWEAAVAAREAAGIRLDPVQEAPAPFHRHSAAVAPTVLAENEAHRQGAPATGRRAAGLLRPLAAEDPAEHARRLARVLLRIEGVLYALGRCEEARAAKEERDAVLRQSAAVDEEE
ncbi:hypothetical protein AB0I39_40450 [Kitasatospora purpeofusca]|uniref:hypothetical protein n=1 Tax=Kitasatospora purpeofusca TaxID=67352 RepID=UPI0033E80008